MEDKLYDLMDWAEIEAVVYSEETHPRSILGPHVTAEGILIQCFFPGEEKVSVKTLSDGKLHPMVMEDEAGFFAVLITGKKIPPYVFVTGEEENRREVPDPYAFGPLITPKEEKKFQAGIYYDA